VAQAEPQTGVFDPGNGSHAQDRANIPVIGWQGTYQQLGFSRRGFGALKGEQQSNCHGCQGDEQYTAADG
jgi:hypothetical protein